MGSDRFRLAVSADGSTFFDALSVDNATGIVDQPRLPRFKAYTNYDNYVGMANHDPVAFEAAACKVGFLGFGFYPRSGFMHIDLGPARQWGERFPARSSPFAAETPPAREVLAQSQKMRGGSASEQDGARHSMDLAHQPC